MITSTKQIPIFDQSEVSTIADEVMRVATKFVTRILAFLAFALIEGFRYGFKSNDYPIILGGSVISLLGFYGLCCISSGFVSGKPIKSIIVNSSVVN